MRAPAFALLAAAAVSCGGGAARPASPGAGAVAGPQPGAVPMHAPATLEATRPQKGEPRAVHVVVKADAGYRARPRWKEDITDDLDLASQYLTPLLGIKLQVDSIDAWDRADTVDPLSAAALASLAGSDAHTTATWVIGFASPTATATKDMAQLGAGVPLGRAVIVRGWNDGAEPHELRDEVSQLAPAARAEYLESHRRHKETVVLLHELAATLGAIAETDGTWIQHPMYSARQSKLSDRNRELLQVALDMRLADRPDDAIAHALIEAIDRTEWGGWLPASRDEVLAQLRNIADAARAGKTATADVPPAVYAQFDRVRQLAARDPAHALAELDNLLIAYPANVAMHQLKCDLLLAKPKDAATRAACARVSELAPGDPAVHLAIGEALYKAGDAAAAHTELAAAAGKIGNLDAGKQAEAWKRLVALYAAHDALTWTEDAIAAGKLAGAPEATKVAQLRARDGIPRGAAFVRPEDEPALVAAVASARSLVNAGKYGDAGRAIAADQKRWPGAAGLLAERCELELRSGAPGAARADCDAAIRADADASWALYLAGVIALQDVSAAGTQRGEALLRRAIASDPDLGPAWRTLGKALERAHDRAGLAELSAAYAAKFNQALPP